MNDANVFDKPKTGMNSTSSHTKGDAHDRAKSKAARWKYMDKTMAEKNRAPQAAVLAKAMTRSRRLRGEASSMEEDIN